MAAGIYDIVIEQGADWELVFVWKDGDATPYDLSGWAAQMQVRKDYASKAKVFDLTTENSRIVLNFQPGQVAITIPAELSRLVTVSSADLAWKDGKRGVAFEYDLELTNADGKTKRLLQGAAFFIPEVTR